MSCPTSYYSSESNSLPRFKSGARLTSCKSYHGIPVDELSSALQKCIRRGELHLARVFLREWLSFQVWNEGSETQKKSIFTNLRNRILHKTLFEDVLAFDEIPLTLMLLQFDERLVKDRESTSTYTPLTESEIIVFMELVQRMCTARKYRIGSHMRHHYTSNSISNQPFDLLSPIQYNEWTRQLNLYSPKDDSWWRLFFSVFAIDDGVASDKSDKSDISNLPSNKQMQKRRVEFQKLFWNHLKYTEPGNSFGRYPGHASALREFTQRCHDLYQIHRKDGEGFCFHFMPYWPQVFMIEIALSFLQLKHHQ